jgi:hypothetical protein
MKTPRWFQKLDRWADEPRHSIPAVLTLGAVGIFVGSLLSIRGVMFMVVMMFVGLVLIVVTEVKKRL